MTPRPVALGVHDAVAHDCPVRVPVLVLARSLGTPVKDRIDLAACHFGSKVHAAFEGGGDAAAIAAKLPPGATVHATHLATLGAGINERFPGCDVVHERRVSTLLAGGMVRLSGRVDTVVVDAGGDPVAVIERKSGRALAWHHQQVRAYLAMLGGDDVHGELWYSATGDVERVSPTPGILATLSTQAAVGLALDRATVARWQAGPCAACPARDCGVRWWRWPAGQ